MRTETTLQRLLLVLGLASGLTGCVVETYPVAARDTRRVPAADIPHPAASGIRPVAAVGGVLPPGPAAPQGKLVAAPVIPAERPGAVVSGSAPVVGAAPTASAAPAIVDPAAEKRHPTTGALTADFLRFGELPAMGTSGPAASPENTFSAVRRVTFADEGADSDVAPDPAGRFIVFASTRHRNTSDLYLQRTGSSAVTQLTSDPANEVMPALSPDGRWLAFASDRAGTWDLYATDLQGGPTIRLTDDGSQNLHPSFSADGRRMVYCSRAPRSGVWELVVIDLDHPGQRRLVGHGLFPSFCPVDDRVVYQRARERGGRWFSLWTLDLTHENPGPPTEIAASSNAALITPAWSPDGRQVVFCTVMDPAADTQAAPRDGRGASDTDVWVCDADGGGRARLTRGGHAHFQPAWHGRDDTPGWIYFVSDRSARGSENVYALQVPDFGTNEADPTRPPTLFEAGVPVLP